MTNWSIQDLKQYAQKHPNSVTNEIKELIKKAPKQSKYRNNKLEVDGILF